MSEKRKKGRRAYLDSFKKNEDGKYTYEGNVYVCSLDDKRLKKELIILWAIGIIMIASALGAGCITAPGTIGCAYILLPYAVGLIADVSACYGLGRLTAGGSPMYEYVYDGSVKKIPFRSALAALLHVLVIAGEIVYVFINGFSGQIVGSIVFIMLEGVSACSGLVLRHRILKIYWEKLTK